MGHECGDKKKLKALIAGSLVRIRSFLDQHQFWSLGEEVGVKEEEEVMYPFLDVVCDIIDVSFF